MSHIDSLQRPAYVDRRRHRHGSSSSVGRHGRVGRRDFGVRGHLRGGSPVAGHGRVAGGRRPAVPGHGLAGVALGGVLGLLLLLHGPTWLRVQAIHLVRRGCTVGPVRRRVPHPGGLQEGGRVRRVTPHRRGDQVSLRLKEMEERIKCAQKQKGKEEHVSACEGF